MQHGWKPWTETRVVAKDRLKKKDSYMALWATGHEEDIGKMMNYLPKHTEVVADPSGQIHV